MELPANEHIVETRARKAARESFALVRAQQDTCTELPCSRELRRFAFEYNDRLIRDGRGMMPSSFNVLEAFLEFSAQCHVFSLRSQRDHSIVLIDFLDRITAGTIGGSLSDPPTSFLPNEGSRTFAFGGVELLRWRV